MNNMIFIFEFVKYTTVISIQLSSTKIINAL